MLIRDIFIVESGLGPARLAANDGKYLRMLVDLAKDEVPLPVNTEERKIYGDTVTIEDESIRDLERALKSSDIYANIPKKIKVKTNAGKVMSVSTSVLFLGDEFLGGRAAYNAGHLAELFMGLCVSAKFFNLGEELTARQVIDMIQFVDNSIEGKNYVFTLTRRIDYPEPATKSDTLNFLGRVPARSAESFIKQAKAGMFDSKLNAILNSTVRYVNESTSVTNSIRRVREDPNNNLVDVVSDGTTEAKGTKADLVLKVDGKKINLLSLKTYSSDTLGQFSGLKFENLYKWFSINFGIDITPYKNLFDPGLEASKIFQNLLKFYDDVIYPQVQRMIEDQKPGVEADIVRQLARAAKIYARGEKLEDVEIVKLDDKVSKGNYKVLKFSDDLDEAMKHLDLETRYVAGKGQGRTIQIWVKPAPGEKLASGSNKLCQFRTQKMGKNYRNYFESGPALEMLTQVAARGTGTREIK